MKTTEKHRFSVWIETYAFVVSSVNLGIPKHRNMYIYRVNLSFRTIWDLYPKHLGAITVQKVYA